MKKSYLCGIALLAPALLLTGCGGGSNMLSISANWYKDTGLSDQISQTYEKLEYAVTFRGSEVANEFKAEYDDGTYTVELKSENRNSNLVYVLTTTLEIGGKYSLGTAAGEPFADSIQSEVVFQNVRTQLKPVVSTKTVKSTVPNAQSPSTLENAYSSYEYSFVTTYADDLTSFRTTYTDLTKTDGTPVVNDYKYDEKGTYLDNEEILFAIRGLSLATSNLFYSFNPAKRAVEMLTTSTAESEDLLLKNLSIDGGAGADVTIPCNKVTLAYSSANPGNTQTLWYAKTDNTTSNTYRNVLVYMEAPVMYNLGTLCYTLKTAQFTNK